MLGRLWLVLSLATASCDVDCGDDDEDLIKMTLLQMSFTMPREITRTRLFFRD